MSNAFQVLKRDILRLIHTPAALIVVIALIILPSVYTWYNVCGFWDPYNNTGNLRVDVVNQDNGAANDLVGDIDVGDLITEELSKNDQLGWHFTTYDDAMDALARGESYAAFVIPADFSEKLLTLVSGDFQKPDIVYYVNEKSGPVAPKITDTGATTLDESINAAFVSTVSHAAIEMLNTTLDESKTSLEAGQSEATQKLDEAINQLHAASQSISATASSVSKARGNIHAAQSSAKQAARALEGTESSLQGVSSAAQDAQAALSSFSSSAESALNELNAAIRDILEKYTGSETPDASLLPEDIQALLEQTRKLSELIYGTAAPAASSAVSAIDAAASSLQGALVSESYLSQELIAILDELDGVLDTAEQALASTEESLSRAAQSAEHMRDDMAVLMDAGILSDLLHAGDLDENRISEFIASPTHIVTEQLYELHAYGAAMAPLFMNLTFWIGAFMLLVIMKQEVDGQGVRRLTLTGRYIGRFLLFAILAILQAVICVSGVIALGVEPANIPALYFASAISSLAYLSIIYMLSVTLQHIGKGICIVLVFAQIPGATGLYPIEMTSPFFQALYPFMPFTYGIGAMRESICGFYGNHFSLVVAMLLVFFIAFLVLGLLLRPLMGNVNRMVAHQVRESGIYNGEDVELPVRTYRISQMMRMLFDRKDFKEEIERRYQRFERWRPRIIKALIVIGIAIPVVSVLIFALTPTEKITMLTVWLIAMAALFIAMVVMETWRYSLQRQLKLGAPKGSDFRTLYHTQRETARAVSLSDESVSVVEARFEEQHEEGDQSGDDADA